MTSKKAFMISLGSFIVVAVIALVIVLGKGHIASYAFVKIEDREEEKKQEEKNPPKLEILLENQYLSSTKKESIELVTTVDGEEVIEGVELESSDETIAKIKDGKVVAVKDGKATITARYQEVEATADINVITPIKSMKFTATSSSIRIGKELQMKLQVTPSDASISTLKYSSSDEEIATVNANGIVTGVSAGKVTITVTDEYTGLEKSVNITIKK